MDKENTAVQQKQDEEEDAHSAKADVSVVVIEVGSAVEAESSGSPVIEVGSAVEAESSGSPVIERGSAVEAESSGSPVIERGSAVEAESSGSTVIEVESAVEAESSGSPVIEVGSAVEAESSGSPVIEVGSAVEAESSGSPVIEVGSAVEAESSGSPVIEVGSAVEAESSGSPVTERLNSSPVSEKEIDKSNSCLQSNEDSVHEELKAHSDKTTDKVGVGQKKPTELVNNGKENRSTDETAQQWESEVKALQDIVITSNFEDCRDEPFSETLNKNTERTGTPDVEVRTPEISTAVGDSMREGPPFSHDDSQKCPYSPYSDKEADVSEERALMIDESEASHSESVADVSCNSGEILDSENVDEATSKVLHTTEETVTANENSIKEATPGDKKAVPVKILNLVEESTKEATPGEEKALPEPLSSVEESTKEATPSDKKAVPVKTLSSVEESTKEATPGDKKAVPVKTLSSIEESIERCIAIYSCDTTGEVNDMQPEAYNPKIFPKKKRSKPFEVGKFPRNYGFKIITNKIDLCGSPKGAFSTYPKLREDSPTPSSNLPVKRIKIQGKPLLDSTPRAVESEEGTDQDNGVTDTLSPTTVAKMRIAFRKSTEESGEKVTPKERPTIGLKVRDVESINAAIRTVKAPVSQVLSDGTNSNFDSSASEKGLPDKEITYQSSDKYAENGHEGTSLVYKSSLRPIAPKCEPIASNDQQSIKMIRDLIQLPSIPVYVPDVSDSKHFGGRLNLCHGCGDRFVLLKSLLEHQNRRSCVIKFQCLKCDSAVLCFFNRCEFIRHLYNHNQTLTTVMLQYHISVERLPPQNSGIFDVQICQECKVFLKVPLSTHMQSTDSKELKGPALALKCQWCSLLLPSKCAYHAHRRMHFLQPPHVCPECGDMSPDLPSFNVHINSVCFHTSKRSLFKCSFCQTKMYDARKLERHIRTKHIRDVFKCNFCFVACFNLKDLEKHRRVNHEDKLAEEPEDDDDSGLKYAFHLCDMCPNRLIRRVRLGQHVWDHTFTGGDITYIYECRKCKISFNSKEVLSAHASVCTVGPSTSNAQAPTTVVANGSDVLIQQPQTITSDVRLPFVVEAQAPVTDSSSEVLGDFTDTVIVSQQTPYEEDENNMMEIDGTDSPPQSLKAPAPQQITQPVILQAVAPAVTQSMKNLVPKKKKKKKATNKSPVRTDFATFISPKDDNSFNSFERESFVGGDPLDAEEDSMEVVLNCLECGTNLTSELGSYCTLCEQKREAGDALKAVTPTAVLNVAKKKPTKKSSGGNFSCRICNALISKTCDKAAIKRHFISKHKEIFIAALQSGMITKKDGSQIIKPNILRKDRSDSTSKEGSPVKKSPVASFCKLSPKKKKKKPKKPVSESDTDEDESSYVASSPSREGKKPKEKRKKSYSPAFPALEQGMVAPDGKSSETAENMRTCYKCSFKSVDKEEFMTHVATHKTNAKDLQCPACGMCFVVRPSLEKHLLILHGMQNVEEYLLEHGFSAVAKVSEKLDVDMLDVNQCKVCHMKFDTEALLEKHFRTHGSAFLQSKQFRRSS